MALTSLRACLRVQGVAMPGSCTRRTAVSASQVVGAKPEEVLREHERELHIGPEDWNEELLESHEDFLVVLGGMRERVSAIVAKVEQREKLVQVREERLQCSTYCRRLTATDCYRGDGVTCTNASSVGDNQDIQSCCALSYSNCRL